jgi:RNA polymerase sigma factor (sigma-70 family)
MGLARPGAEVSDRIEDLLRDLAPQVLGALVRRYGHFDAAEDAVQEALLVAATQWPVDGVPTDPRPWLIRVASRKLIDQLRQDQARRDREDVDATRRLPPAEGPPEADQDDSLVLLFLCCHPVLSRESQVALTLRAVGGLTTEEIAHAYLLPLPTMAQRITRAKQRIKAAGSTFRLPSPKDRAERLDAVLQVLYLIFNEGYTATSGPELNRVELSAEAIRLTRMLHRLLPADGEVAGLLALMLLTDARRPARTDPDGLLVPMHEQDRRRWNAGMIAEGTDLLTAAMARGKAGPYQLQAAIAAVHDEAADAADTDWKQILGLYGLLRQTTDNPLVTLNLAVAAGMVHGPTAGLRLLDKLADDKRFTEHHRLAAVRAHLLETAGDIDAAAEHYRLAARQTTSIPEQRYLLDRAARLTRA